MDESRTAPRPPLAVVPIALRRAQLALYAATSGPLAYGRMSDEYYYLDCARRLAWGYVDHPPLAPALLAVVHAWLGDSLAAMHLLPALAACADWLLLALLARELGGGRVAQTLAVVAGFAAPVYQAVAGFYSMNAFEPALWTASAWLLARIANGAGLRAWTQLGVVLGIGLLNKISMLWLGAGLALGLLFTPARRWLATPGPWLAAAIALALFAPHLAWQLRNGWPTLEFMHNASQEKLLPKSPLAFAGEQLLVLGPLGAVVWAGGLAWYFRARRGAVRALAWIWIGTLGLLLATGNARSNYSAPAYCVLLAAGGVAFEEFASRRSLRASPAALVVLLLLQAAVTAPLAVPVLPPGRVHAYSAAIGVEAPRDEIYDPGELPLHLALRFGWRELAEAVQRGAQTLTPQERAEAVVLARSFGEAGSLGFFRRELDLPPVVSGHNNYWLWGLGEQRAEVALALARNDAQLLRWYREVTPVAIVECRFCTRALDGTTVYACRGLRVSREQLWAEAKHYQ